MNLYEITEEISNLETLLNELIDQETGEILEVEVFEELEKEVEVLLQKKSENIIKFIRNKQADIESLKIEIKRLTTLKKTSENKIKNLKEYILDNMQRLETKKIETKLGNISRTKARYKVEIKDIEKLEDKYYQIEKKAKKKEILEALKKGVEVEGAFIKLGNESLLIK